MSAPKGPGRQPYMPNVRLKFFSRLSGGASEHILYLMSNGISVGIKRYILPFEFGGLIQPFPHHDVQIFHLPDAFQK